MNLKVKSMVKISLVTALICIIAPFSIPIGPIPISLSLIIIYIGLYALKPVEGVISVLLYIIIGLIGLPVFSGFTGGPGKLAGPTGGFILSYILIAVIVGNAVNRTDKRFYHGLYMFLSLAISYLLGTLWFLFIVKGYTFVSALTLCVFPFVPFDLIKIAIALILGPIIRNRIRNI